MDFYISALEVSALRRQEDDAGVYHDKKTTSLASLASWPNKRMDIFRSNADTKKDSFSLGEIEHLEEHYDSANSLTKV